MRLVAGFGTQAGEVDVTRSIGLVFRRSGTKGLLGTKRG